MIKTRRVTAMIISALVLMVAGCQGSGQAPPSTVGSLDVIATTTVFADIVRNVGGDRVNVRSIIPAGAGPEDFEPRPEDARLLADADLVVSNGVGLDDFLDGLIAGSGSTARRLVLGDGIETLTVEGEANPHFWLDPNLVISHYVPAIEAALSDADPGGAAGYADRAAAYATRLRALDETLAAMVQTIPPDRRRLVTFHDAFPYFARRYGFDIVGVILENPGQEPSAADLAALVADVRAAGVPAVFSEAQFSPKLAQTLASEAGITRVVSTLYTDSLGDPPADTYEGMLRWDMEQIVEALR